MVREGTESGREANGEGGKSGGEGGERKGRGRYIPVPDWESEKVATLVTLEEKIIALRSRDQNVWDRDQLL